MPFTFDADHPEAQNDPCHGPNHGLEALPKGIRFWVPANMVSLTQKLEDGMEHTTFCGIDCFCDWHGANTAALIDALDQIPGEFMMVWISEASTTVQFFDDWGALTKKVGDYQMKILERGLLE